ncbi:hypothetical protein [Sphingobium sp. SCG-1]|uniref:hypothetical protein n=1 Tax=Sphingobium sp. SCG-1 TaxID=2072936 RepID=UPI0011AB79A5|nr:hypothetical protein [Sphingobium sp. SCG-1]
MPSFIRIGVYLIALTLCNITTAHAEDDNTELAKETARIAAETALINAQAAQRNAEAALVKAKVDAWGLPSYSGETELGSGAGVIEATILATAAANAAGRYIAATAPQLTGGKIGYLVLAGDEGVNFSQLAIIRVQLDGLRVAFQNAGVPDPDLAGTSRLAPGMAIAAVSAVSGLFRAETSVTGVEINGISDRTLATATSGALSSSFLASAPTIPRDEAFVSGKLWMDQAVLQRIDTLSGMRQQAIDLRKTLGEKPVGANAAKATQLDSVVARFDSAMSKFLSPDDKGTIPAAEAARVERLGSRIGSILRVYVDKAGGSIVNTKNISTIFGVDPVKISGGLIASYIYTDPNDGSVKKSGVLVCRTTLTALRHIQESGRKATNKTAKSVSVACSESL